MIDLKEGQEIAVIAKITRPMRDFEMVDGFGEIWNLKRNKYWAEVGGKHFIVCTDCGDFSTQASIDVVKLLREARQKDIDLIPYDDQFKHS